MAEVLRIHHISAQNMVYIGDNEARDIVPALQANIMAIHYDEAEQSEINDEPLRVNSLANIQNLMELQSGNRSFGHRDSISSSVKQIHN